MGEYYRRCCRRQNLDYSHNMRQMTIYLDRIVGAAVVILVICLVGCRRGGPVFDTTWSPQRTYKVELSGILTEPPPYSFMEHEITFAASKLDGQFAKGRLWMGDHMDGAFRDNYPHHDWIAENLLRFQSAGRKYSQTSDRIFVRNTRPGPIPFLVVSYTDRFVLLEVGPGATVHFMAPRGSTGFLGVSAPTGTGTRMIYATEDLFMGAHKRAAPAEVEVEISEDRVTMNVKPQGTAK